MTKTRTLAGVLATAVTLSGIIACSPQETAVTPESHEPTSFNCMPSEGGWATFAQRGTAISTVPMIVWNTAEFGNDYTPDERCRIVSQRFTMAVADNGGKLSHLDLTTGTLNNYAVVCFVLNRSSTCNDSNLLLHKIR